MRGFMLVKPRISIVDGYKVFFAGALLPNDRSQPTTTLTSIDTKPNSRKLACVKKFMYITVAVPQMKPVMAAREPMRGKKIPMRNRPPMAPLSRPRMVLK